MVYGDGDEQNRPIPWKEFEYTEYLFRLQDLLKERGRAFAAAHHPEDPRAEAAGAEWRRLDRQIEETALELAAYSARRQLEAE